MVTRTLLILLAVVPGTSPFLLGHGVLGSLLLFVGLNAWNLVLIGSIWIGDEASLLTGAGVTLGILTSVGSVVWTAVMTSPRRRQRLKKIADRALEVGLFAYLRGKLPAARSAIDAGLRRAGRDPDLLFVGWKLAREMQDRSRARRLLRRLRRVDLDGKWTWELGYLETERGGQDRPQAEAS